MRLRLAFVCALIATTAMTFAVTPAGTTLAASTVGDPEHPFSDPIWFPLREPARVSCATTNCAGPYHGFEAIDWIGDRGDPIFAAGSGIFHVGAVDPGCRTDGTTTFGTWAWIDHGPAGITRYAHLDSILVQDGQLVTPATQIATMGNSGDQAPCETNYLHMEFRSGDSVDSRLPVPSLGACVDGTAISLPQEIGFSSWDSVPPQIHWTPRGDHTCHPRAWPATPIQPTATVQPGVAQLEVRPSARPNDVDSVHVRIELYHPSLGRFGTAIDQRIPPTRSAATFTGLLAGRTYRARVSFHGAAGWSAWSPAVTAVTGHLPTTPDFRYLTSTYSTVGYGWYRGDNVDVLHEVAIRRAEGTAWGSWTYFDVPVADLYYRFAGLDRGASYQVTVRARNQYGTSAWATPRSISTLGCETACTGPGVFTSVTPTRYADSRDQPTFDGRYRDTGRRPGGSSWEIQIAGRGEVPASATAAIVNVTALRASRAGFVTVYPCATLPQASSVNFRPGSIEPNEVIAKLSPTGSVCIYTSSDVDIIVDVVGHATMSPYLPLVPARFADSRPSPTFDGAVRDTGIRRGGTVWEIPIAGRGSVPATAETATLNLTATRADARGYATVYPCGSRPLASSLNFDAGTTRANELVAKLSPTGSICIFTSVDSHLVVDVVGATTKTDGFSPITPVRLADSRRAATVDGGYRDTGRRPAGGTWEIAVEGRAGIVGARTVIANVTVTGAVSPGFLTVHACGRTPVASTLNYAPGVTRANETIARLSDAGTLCISTSSPVHVIVDVVGFTRA